MPRLIKKYKNRRLYDTKLSKYITIEDLHSYVIDKIDFSVVDASTGEDLTRATLLQVMIEIESQPSQFFSEEALKQLIILANHPLNKSFNKIIEQVLASFEKTDLAEQYQELADNWQKSSQSWLKNWESMFKKPS